MKPAAVGIKRELTGRASKLSCRMRQDRSSVVDDDQKVLPFLYRCMAGLEKKTTHLKGMVSELGSRTTVRWSAEIAGAWLRLGHRSKPGTIVWVLTCSDEEGQACQFVGKEQVRLSRSWRATLLTLKKCGILA